MVADNTSVIMRFKNVIKISANKCLYLSQPSTLYYIHLTCYTPVGLYIKDTFQQFTYLKNFFMLFKFNMFNEKHIIIIFITFVRSRMQLGY